MDDKLFYVESPDGQVLGPMNMIQILEGIAAEAILESARICEVGRTEWVPLSEVAYTRSDDPLAGEVGFGPAPEAMPGASATPVASPNESPLAPEAAPASLELENMPLGSDVTVLGDPAIDQGSPLAPARETPAVDEGSPPAPAWETPAVDEGSPPAPAWETPAVEEPGSLPGVSPGPLSGDPPPTERSMLEAAGATPPPETTGPTEVLPVEPAPPATAEPEVPPVPGAGDFSLDLPETGSEEPEEEWTDDGETSHRRPWWVPVAVAVALPVVGGIYLQAGGKIPFLARSESPSPPPPSTPPATAEPAPASPYQEAWNLLASGRANEATAAFREALSTDPQNAELHHGLGRSALAAGDPELAVTHLERAIEIDPLSPGFLADLVRAQLEAGSPRLAEESATQLRALAPDLPIGHLLLGRARAKLGNAEGAVQELAQYTAAVPDDRVARLDLARALAGTGRTESAIGEIEIYLQDRPDDRGSQRMRLDWLLSVGREAEAGAIYAALARENPESGYHQYLAGLAHPDSEEGVAFLRAAIAIEPEDGDAHAVMGRYLANLGRRREAAEALGRALDLRAGSAEEWALLAELRPSLSEAPAAQTPQDSQLGPVAPARSAGVKLAPRIDRLRAALDREDYTRAREILDQARRDHAGDPDISRNLGLWSGIVYFEEGRFDDALTMFHSLDPDASYEDSGWGKGAVRNWEARVLLAKGDVRSAITMLDQVGRDDPDEYAVARLWEGVALTSLGMSDLATRTWSRLPADVRGLVGGSGEAAVRSAEYLVGAISEKTYRTMVRPVPRFENDMHFFLGYAADRARNGERARVHFTKAIESSQGHEFPFHLAQAQVSGNGILRGGR